MGKITFQGLDKAIDLQESGKNSNLCFIAMSFKSETKPIREAFKSALLKTGTSRTETERINQAQFRVYLYVTSGTF
jgi:hypothetical protein